MTWFDSQFVSIQEFIDSYIDKENEIEQKI